MYTFKKNKKYSFIIQFRRKLNNAFNSNKIESLEFCQLPPKLNFIIHLQNNFSNKRGVKRSLIEN